MPNAPSSEPFPEHSMRLAALLLATALASSTSSAQSALRAAPSTRATAEVTLSAPRVQGQPAPAALKLKVDYGQPHARGREVPTELANDGTVWRTGANSSTTLTIDTDITIGGTTIPKGAYSLYTIREAGKYLLIVNSNTGQWGTEYKADKDFARIPLRAKMNSETRESLVIAFVPANDPPARGVLSISWGKLELSADWAAK